MTQAFGLLYTKNKNYDIFLCYKKLFLPPSASISHPKLPYFANYHCFQIFPIKATHYLLRARQFSVSQNESFSQNFFYSLEAKN
jgi:hypothetical protein